MLTQARLSSVAEPAGVGQSDPAARTDREPAAQSLSTTRLLSVPMPSIVTDT
jgi:hypothetical protein